MTELTSSNRTINPRALPRTSGAPHRRTGRVRHAIGYVLLCLVALLFVSPLVYMVATSLKPSADVFTTPPTLWGSSIEWGNYAQAFTYLPFARFILNGIIVAAAGTAINVAVAVLSGYAFSRLRWRGGTPCSSCSWRR
ncbi:carbohydrate ABC transporter permease [Curtobacterium sp. YC1]|uniref:carbohydrate ABC transporter permease n=1 Tax=Curtobacterium sp. YC1 TaxID=2795488 RepID=UPI0018E55041|nr:carbohydrate ABC transporter permease [Curtobacterium sp. YC1]QQD75820.1 carbohydrate ABC transporter permease [Curtobacterium sp. YC1]